MWFPVPICICYLLLAVTLSFGILTNGRSHGATPGRMEPLATLLWAHSSSPSLLPTRACLELYQLPRVKIGHWADDHVPLTADPDLCVLALREDSCGFFLLQVYI